MLKSRFLIGLFSQGMDVQLFNSVYKSPKVEFLLAHAAFSRDVLKLKKGQRAVISNGRVRARRTRALMERGKNQPGRLHTKKVCQTQGGLDVWTSK